MFDKYKIGQQVVTSTGITGEIVAKRTTMEKHTFLQDDDEYVEFLVGSSVLKDDCRFANIGTWVREKDIAYKVNDSQMSLWKKVLGGN